jgi:hypothetical protein
MGRKGIDDKLKEWPTQRTIPDNGGNTSVPSIS